MKNEMKHMAHSGYRCEYHIVFAPKHRRNVIYKQIRKNIGEIFRKLCSEMKAEIIEAEACVDHIHMLVRILPYMRAALFVGTLKSKSALMIFDRHANLRYRYGHGVFRRYSRKERENDRKLYQKSAGTRLRKRSDLA